MFFSFLSVLGPHIAVFWAVCSLCSWQCSADLWVPGINVALLLSRQVTSVLINTEFSCFFFFCFFFGGGDEIG